MTAGIVVGGLLALCTGLLVWAVRRRNLDRWLVPYLLESSRRRAPTS